MFPRRFLPLVAAICLILLVVPAGAVTIKHIDAAVSENGDTLITADYTLEWAEKAIVYPAAVPLIQGYPKKNVQIVSVSPDKAQVSVQHLVKVTQMPDARRYTTPAFSLADARKEVGRFWFGDMITLDGTAGSLTIRFPDGEIIEYQDLTAVPSFEHVTGGL
jgi:hypothetical protein